jgi:hypothetical protein
MLHVLSVGQDMGLALAIALPVELRSRCRLLYVQCVFVSSFLFHEITPPQLIRG